MIDSGKESDPAAELRRKAEAKAQEDRLAGLSDSSSLSTEDNDKLLHELRVHQIELEMQNEELRRSQLAADAARERYFDLYDVAPVGYCTVSETGLIIEANLTSAALLKTPRQALIKQPISRFIVEEDQQSYYQMRSRLIQTGTLQNCELRLKNGDGETIDVLFDATVALDENRTQVSRIILTDITARTEAKKAQRELEAHVKTLESLGVLAGGIAHDFNNLLTSILGNADFALGKISPESPLRAPIESIVDGAMKAAELSSQMLAYSGKGRFLVRPLDISREVRSIARKLESAKSNDIEFEYKLAESPPPVEGDSTQIVQVITNLVNNAAEALGNSSGVISIQTTVENCTTDFLRKSWIDDNLEAGQYVCLKVTDTGIGMNRDTQSKMFDPFFSTKFIGRGLGLAALLGIVRGHQGAIKIDSIPGKGTSAAIYFPTMKASAMGRRHSVEEKMSSRSSGKVVLIDDDAHVRSETKRMIETFGYEVLEAGDGIEGLEIISHHVKEIVMVLLDLGMPKMSSEETLERIHSISPELKVILSSGFVDDEVLVRFASAGFAGFIQKPYRPSTLRRKMSEALKRQITIR